MSQQLQASLLCFLFCFLCFEQNPGKVPKVLKSLRLLLETDFSIIVKRKDSNVEIKRSDFHILSWNVVCLSKPSEGLKHEGGFVQCGFHVGTVIYCVEEGAGPEGKTRELQPAIQPSSGHKVLVVT